MKKLYIVCKARLGADCCSDHELLTTKFRVKLKKVGYMSVKLKICKRYGLLP